MIKFGFAKAYNKIYCKQLPLYQELNLKEKSEGLGLYSYVKKPLTEYQLFSYFFRYNFYRFVAYLASNHLTS